MRGVSFLIAGFLSLILVSQSGQTRLHHSGTRVGASSSNGSATFIQTSTKANAGARTATRVRYANGFHPVRDSVISFPGQAGGKRGSGSSLVVEAPRVHVPRGVTIRIKDYDSVEFRSEGDILIEGKLEAFGADMRIDAAGDLRATGGIITNGGAGANAAGQVPTVTGGPGTLGGNGGGGYGGSGGSGGGGGGSGYPNETNPGMGTGGTGPGTPSTQVTSNCSSGALFPSGGSAGGSNGTKGAQSQGIDGFFRYIAAEPIGAPVVGMTPPSAGGGSGGGGGCGWYNITNGVKTILSAGGGGGGGGGGAGNVILRSTGTITIDGSGITANGGNGGNAQPGSGTLARTYDGQSHSYTYGGDGGGGGAGGAGGSVFLQAPTVVLNAAITADGGWADWVRRVGPRQPALS